LVKPKIPKNKPNHAAVELRRRKYLDHHPFDPHNGGTAPRVAFLRIAEVPITQDFALQESTLVLITVLCSEALAITAKDSEIVFVRV